MNPKTDRFFRLMMNLKAHHLLFLLALVFSGLTEVSAGPAALPSSAKKDASPAKESLKSKLDAYITDQGVDEATKAKLLKSYQSIQDNLQNIENYKAQENSFKKANKQAPVALKKLQNDIKQAQQKQKKENLEDFNKIPLEELEQRLIIERGKVSNIDDQLTKLEDELSVQSSRPQNIRKEMLEVQQEYDALQKKPESQPAKTGTPLEQQLQQSYTKTSSEANDARLKMLAAEAVSNPARVEVLKTQIQLMELEKNIVNTAINAIDSILADRREQKAKEMDAALSQAENGLSDKHPLIQNLTRQNIQYSRDLQEITEKTEYYNEQKNKLEELISQINTDYKSAEKKIRLAGLSPALGKILHNQRRNLLAQDSFTSQSETIQNETAATSLGQFSVEDKLKQSRNIDAELKSEMDEQVDQALPVQQRMMVQAEARVLLNNQHDILKKLSAAYATYLRTLGDFDFACQQLINLKARFSAYLDEKLLWVKSSESINTKFIYGLYHSAQWLLSPFNWLSVLEDTVGAVSGNLLLASCGLLAFGFLLLSKKQIKQKIAFCSQKVEKLYTDNFNYTLMELAFTLMLVLPLPLLIHFFGKFLLEFKQISNFTKAFAEGLQASAIPLFFLQFFYRLYAPAGIARKHFQWSEETTRLLRKQIAWLRFVVVAGMFLVSGTAASKLPEPGETIGRLAFIIILVSLAVFFGRLLHPVRGIVKKYYFANPDSWLTRMRYGWYAAMYIIPLIVIGFAVAGYYLSALELEQKLVLTIRLIFLLIFVHAMVVRWLNLVNRQLAIKNARQKRKAAAAQVDKTSAVGAEDPILPVDEQQIDIPKINVQTIKLLNVFIGISLFFGFWLVWKNIVPAFSFLDDIVLWQHQVIIDSKESVQPITMTNLLLAGLYIFIVTVAIRNFYGIMELLVFQRWSFDTGNRYAINQLAKYLLIAIGTIRVVSELGGSWSQVQWLVAALSVGLGFGLQEIFANLVSGIILLFERPIRIGDVVTIDSITGKVSRIEMRATTLIDFDQKDLIVPNKTFITSQLVNWTLSDAITRIVIPVGIAYDSNVELAHQVMIDTVRATPLVLSEPEPGVVFVGFGESSLDFSIRIYVNELKNRLPVSHDLLMRLEKALREHHIEIPFPQRDIHIRSAQGDTEQHLAKTKGSNEALTAGQNLKIMPAKK